MVLPDLFAPGLAQAGLGPDRVIYVEAGDDRTVLACMEEGLRHGGLGAVVGEVACLSMTASRRLQLAGNAPLAGGQTDAVDFGQPTADHAMANLLPNVDELMRTLEKLLENRRAFRLCVAAN